MNENLVDLSEFNLSNEELFATYDISQYQTEKITAPRYSYWKSVARVFFKNKLNIIMLALLGFIVIFAYIYPAIFGFDRYENTLDLNSHHLSPGEAFEYFGGFSIKWLFGAGANGESTFDAVWYGASISISLAFMCALINLTIGVIIGAIWGFSKKVSAINLARRGSPGIRTVLANWPTAASLWGVDIDKTSFFEPSRREAAFGFAFDHYSTNCPVIPGF